MNSLLCILSVITVILSGCATHHESNTFKEERPEDPSKIKTYTYKEALDLAEDSDGFYNFFLLPGIDPDQAYAFEEKFAEEAGFGYNVYTGAHPHSVEVLVRADVPVELLETYIETLATHLQANKATKYTTFRSAITHYMTLRTAMRIPADPEKWSPYIQAEIDRVLLGMLNILVDAPTATGHRVNNAWRTLDRVKFHMYKKKHFPRGYR